MKTKIFLKTSWLSATLTFLLLSCIKDPNGPTIINPPGGGENGNCCKLKANGTIEKCPLDSNLWFINANVGGAQANSPIGSNKLLVPVNLPQNYKTNGTTVKFEYEELKDSVKLNCWFCQTPPLPYGKKIRLCNIKKDSTLIVVMKPVIYLYPKTRQNVNVRLRFNGNLTVTYPDYDAKIQGWEVLAKPDGELLNKADGMEYQYLFWEGTPASPYKFNMNEGFCVKGSDTRAFLQKTLPRLGLTPKEYNDMIVFWLPRMMNNPYNIIHFAGIEYTRGAELNVSPQPDQVIRVFMAYQASHQFVKTNEPVIKTPSRKGFTVVEWGGTELQANAPLAKN